MSRRKTWLGFGAAIAGVGVVAAVAVGWMALGPGPTDFAGRSNVALTDYAGPSPVGVPIELRSADPVTRGAYMARAADCVACHTAEGGAPYAGGRPFKLPFGVLYSPNITPDRETGIGTWSDAAFLRAVHDGVGADGKRLYPAFPYPAYRQLTDGDVLDIKAYLMSQAPVRQAPPANSLAFPYNQRWLMAIWGVLFNRTEEFQPRPAQSPAWNRGAYLVEAAGHCGDCHTPRNLLQAVDQRRKFAGGAAEGWSAYNITGDPGSGVGAWSDQELAAYLQQGHSAGRGAASGPMAEVVDLSLSHLTNADIKAMVTYLRSVPPRASHDLPPVLAQAAPASHRDGALDGEPGKRVFQQACASCHAWSGSGALLAQAQLTGMRSVNDPRATNVAQMVLSGTGPVRGGRPSMPAFARAYSDQEIADVSNYVTARFGAKRSHLSAADVARLRAAN